MRKIIDWILEKVFHRSLRLTFKTLDDDKAILERAKTLCEDYATRRQIRISTDDELGTKFRKLFDNSLVAMSFYDKDGYLLDLNERMRQLCGFDAIGISATPVSSTPPASRTTSTQAVEACSILASTCTSRNSTSTAIWRYASYPSSMNGNS